MMNKSTFLILLTLTFSYCGQRENIADLFVEGVANPRIKLNGTWQINTEPIGEFWIQQYDNEVWKNVKVPGEVMMQGFLIKSDEPFAYRKEIDVPNDFEDKKIYLQFDGVYSYARVWVNGKFVRDHHGGFTRWKCEITPHVKAGEKAWITLEVTDRADEISYASGYAKHQIGGILRDVHLLALPQNHPESISIETDLDAQYKNANLIVSGKLNRKTNSTIAIQLFDDKKKVVPLQVSRTPLSEGDTFRISNTIISPEKWDAEHPNLYELQISLYDDDELVWSQNQKIGFREVEVKGNSFLVNGKSVKLRGACRHDVHPLLGRVSTPEYELKDVLLAKEANMNYIRTSHYPPSDNFLKLCDEYGIYVEDETAICFVINYRIKGYEEAANSQSDTAYTDRYLSQLQEMVKTHRNHPSVVIWSIGNESVYGTNFKKSFDWLQKSDPARPIMFSYPGSTPDSLPQPYNILSMHYPPISGDLNQQGIQTRGFDHKEMPVIFDEWAHVACYNNPTIKEDPNIRNFWGQSLDSMWSKTFDAAGGLGGAIWGIIDETFMLPKNLEGFGETWGRTGEYDRSILGYEGPTVGYGEWGVVDVWRRKKPEFWNTKKAYSPIRLTKTKIEDYQIGAQINIPIYNRFDHTNLKEVKIDYTYKGIREVLPPLDLEPHQKGKLVLPIKEWNANEPIEVSFYDDKDSLIDTYLITQKTTRAINTATSHGMLEVVNNSNTLIVNTDKGNFVIDKKSGLLTSFVQGERRLAISGPQMVYRTKGKRLTYSSNEINTYGGMWVLKKFDYEMADGKVVLTISGIDDKINIDYKIQVLPDGTLTTNYSFMGLPKENIREIGIKYVLDDVFDTLSWKRETYWSSYPKGHLSASTGKTSFYHNGLNTYRKEPAKPWTLDTKSFYYDGIANEQKSALTNIAKATKENVVEYAFWHDNEKRMSVIGTGDVSCRLAKTNNKLELYLNNAIDYIDLSWGNYQRNIQLDGSYEGKSEMHFGLK